MTTLTFIKCDRCGHMSPVPVLDLTLGKPLKNKDLCTGCREKFFKFMAGEAIEALPQKEDEIDSA